MLASVLNSETAIAASVRIIDTFVAMRRALASLAPLMTRIEATERRQIVDQSKNDVNQTHNEERFKLIFDAMNNKKSFRRRRYSSTGSSSMLSSR